MKDALTGASLILVVGIAGCASQSGTPATSMPGGIVIESPIESSGASNTSTKVTIVAPRPRAQTPGLLSLDGSSLASSLAEPAAPTPSSGKPNNYFAGMMGSMPHRLLLGSAPNPTPHDLCVYGSTAPRCYTDASRKQRRQYIADPDHPGHFREVRPGDEKIVEQQIRTEKLIHHSLLWFEK